MTDVLFVFKLVFLIVMFFACLWAVFFVVPEKYTNFRDKIRTFEEVCANAGGVRFGGICLSKDAIIEVSPPNQPEGEK